MVVDFGRLPTVHTCVEHCNNGIKLCQHGSPELSIPEEASPRLLQRPLSQFVTQKNAFARALYPSKPVI